MNESAASVAEAGLEFDTLALGRQQARGAEGEREGRGEEKVEEREGEGGTRQDMVQGPALSSANSATTFAFIFSAFLNINGVSASRAATATAERTFSATHTRLLQRVQSAPLPFRMHPFRWCTFLVASAVNCKSIELNLPAADCISHII